jgi:CheY-like chemotaxis protein
MTKSQCCLLVEDDPDDQQMFMEAIEALPTDIACYAVGNGEEALVTLLNKGFVPDYIFTDLNMPKMNGFDFLKALSRFERFRSIPVIVLSTDYSEENKKKAKQLGATDFYSKTRIAVLKDILKKYFFDIQSKPTVL